MRIASCNDIDPDGDPPPRPAASLDSFLHGLLTSDNLFAAGGLQITDNSTGITFLPGCCDGLEDWRDWNQFVDDGSLLGFGHDPVSPIAERFGDTVRLTVNAEQSDSPVIELCVTELRHLLIGAERDLADFLRLATNWSSRYLPGRCAPVVAALARVLNISAPLSNLAGHTAPHTLQNYSPVRNKRVPPLEGSKPSDRRFETERSGIAAPTYPE